MESLSRRRQRWRELTWTFSSHHLSSLPSHVVWMIGGLATLTECLLVLHARPEVACRYWAGRVALRNCARQYRRAGPTRSEVAENKIA
jgi:hypothetical protein